MRTLCFSALKHTCQHTVGVQCLAEGVKKDGTLVSGAEGQLLRQRGRQRHDMEGKESSDLSGVEAKISAFPY